MLFLEISGWFVDELLLDFRLVVERGVGVGWLWSVGLWSLMGLALVIGEAKSMM